MVLVVLAARSLVVNVEIGGILVVLLFPRAVGLLDACLLAFGIVFVLIKNVFRKLLNWVLIVQLDLHLE